MKKHMLTPPTNLSHEPYMTMWYADLESGKQIWVQISKDATEWVRLGDIFERMVLEERIKLDIKDLIA